MKSGIIVLLIACSFGCVHAQTTPVPVLAPIQDDPSQPHDRHLPIKFLNVAVSEHGYGFEDLWEIARRHNPKIRQVYQGIAAAQGAAVQAGLYPNPAIVPSLDNIGVDSAGVKPGVFFAQEIVTARKKQLARAVAGYDVRVAQTNFEMECLRLQNDVRIAYYNALHAQLSWHIHQYGVNIATELFNEAERLKTSGKTEQIDVLQFRIIKNEQAVFLKQSENEMVAAWEQLVTLLGTPDWPKQQLKGTLLVDLPQYDLETVWRMVAQTSPEIAIANLKVQKARTEVVRQEKERIPNVTAGVAISHDIPAKNTVPFVNVAVPLKIYDRNQGNITRAQAELAASVNGVEAVSLDLRRRLAKVFRDYENARELVEPYEDSIIQDAYNSLVLATESYSKGNKTYLELYQQRKQIMETLIRYIDALKAQAVSAAMLDGLLLRGDI